MVARRRDPRRQDAGRAAARSRPPLTGGLGGSSMKRPMAVLFFAATSAFAQNEIGEVAFANCGSAAGQPAFLRGLALLHNFEYETRGGELPRGAGDRSRVRHGVLGRGDDVHASGLVPAGRRRRARRPAAPRRHTGGARRRRRRPSASATTWSRSRSSTASGTKDERDFELRRRHGGAARRVSRRRRRHRLLRALASRHRRTRGATSRNVHARRGAARGSVPGRTSGIPACCTT